MFSMEEFIIAVFRCVDDWLKIVTQRHPIKRRGFAPRLFDSEVITMEIVAEFQGIDADKAIWQAFGELSRAVLLSALECPVSPTQESFKLST